MHYYGLNIYLLYNSILSDDMSSSGNSYKYGIDIRNTSQLISLLLSILLKELLYDSFIDMGDFFEF